MAAQTVQPWRAESICQDEMRYQNAADVVIVVVSEIVVSGLWYLKDRLVGTSRGVRDDVKWNSRQTPRRR